tara:strand:+ start:402 stop:1043 length:642 start_codon:yes stop_codon:yes gene_type:complete
MLKGYFISGTDTGVGKTLVASILVNKFDAIYYKPIQCGMDKFGNKDSDIVKKNCNRKTIVKETYFFQKAVSPNIASKFENTEVKMIKFKGVLNQKFKKKIFIEGAGGLNVPVNDRFLMTDLIKLFNLPVILVSRSQLGTINHTLLSINLLKQKRIKLRGIVFIGDNEPETFATILKFGKKIYGKKINIIAKIPFKSLINKKSIEEMKALFKGL